MKIGIVSDTHVPDRLKNLHPALLEALSNEKVDTILHAGDVCSWGVIKELETIAPVVAVCGNRDWLLSGKLPGRRMLDLEGVTTALIHGYSSWWNYFIDKFQYVLVGYEFDRYFQMLTRTFPKADVIIFGHTHEVECRYLKGKWIINSGSSGMPGSKIKKPSYGLMKIKSGKVISTEIRYLEGAKIINRQWVRE